MTSTAKVAVVAAGGTGGHMFPAEALSRALSARGWRIVLATDSRGDQYAQQFPAEERLSLEAATFRTGDVIGMIRSSLRISRGTAQARAAFARLRPSVVVGFGGYPSLPSLLAARSRRIPTVIHEQNAVLGRVNRRLAPGATAVACAFPTLLKASSRVRKRLQVVGNPVRQDIAALYDQPYVPPGPTIRLLVTGGSTPPTGSATPTRTVCATWRSASPEASITPRTASAWVRSMRPARKARRVNSPGSAGRAPAAQTARSTDSKSGGEPSVWISATGWPV